MYFIGGKNEKIIEFEIKNSPNEKENGTRYFMLTEGRFSTNKISHADIHTNKKQLEHSLEWIEKFNFNHSDYCTLGNIRVIDLESL